VAEPAIPDVTLPITPKQILDGVEHIVEQTFPRPRQELCAPVGEMERRLASYAGDLVNASYNDAIPPDARQRLARHLFLTERTDEWAPREWDRPQHVNQQPYLKRADQILRVITGKE
jgi:hypothetical protein